MRRMNRISSSSSNTQTKKFFQSNPHPKSIPTKKDRIPRNPLKGVNCGRSGGTESSNNGGISGSVSREAPNGRVRFLISNSCSSSSSSSGASHSRGPVKSFSKTPKSTPVVPKPLMRNKTRVLGDIEVEGNVSVKPTSRKPLKCKRTTPMPRLGQSGKIPTCKSTLKENKAPVLDELPSGSRELKQKEIRTTVRLEDNSAHLTPVSKLGIRSGQSYGSTDKVIGHGGPKNVRSSNERTPPLQESLSPELLCGSSMILSAETKPQTCYATGHILSGITDKRKCRPKGVLIVGENGLSVSKAKRLNNFEDVDDAVIDSSMLTMPLPADASVRWLLSPCDEEKDHEKKPLNDGFYKFRQVIGCEGLDTPSPLSDCSFSSDICNISSGRSLSPEHSGKGMGSTGSLISSDKLSHLRSLVMYPFPDKGRASAYATTPTGEVDTSLHLKDVRHHQYCIGNQKSPSSIDTLGSENVIQTPESNSNSDKYHGLPWYQAERHKSHSLGSDFDSLEVSLQSACLSPKSHDSSWDPNSSSFRFESLATSSDSVDLSQFHRGLGDRNSCHSNSTWSNVSQTHMNISWREEINSQVPEVDELVRRRDALDEIEVVNGSSVKHLTKPRWIQNTDFDMRKDKNGVCLTGQFVDKENASAEKGRKMLHAVTLCSAAESISTDGGGLIHSDDSDWMSCFKKSLGA